MSKWIRRFAAPLIALCLMTSLLCLTRIVPCVWATASEAEPSVQRQYEQTVSKAISYLVNKGRASDGSYSSFSGPGVTALATTALLRHGRSPNEPLVAGSLQYLVNFVQPDGGIYQSGSLYRNYETCLIIMCLTEANRNGRYDQVLARAEKFVTGIQWDEGEQKNASSFDYGGAGYGKHKRPDLSNTSYLVDALAARGHTADSESLQRALVFISRCQNLETEHNTTPFSTRNPDGGFYYTPAAGGTSQAGQTAAGGLRSYASMTYAGLKSMIYAGVELDDPRVEAAIEWIGKNYGLDSNPGLGNSGLFYYYHTFAKALHAMGAEQIRDAAGAQHDWRAELIRELARRQQPDGSWVNENNRWFEGDPNLVTGYALLALSYCQPRSAVSQQ